MAAILITSFAGISVNACVYYGCTPGFWKNHVELWPFPYTPGYLFDDVFDDGPDGIETLIAALTAKGGSGVEGAKRILARTAVAALFNSIVFDWGWDGYPLDEAEVKALVNAAFASDDRNTMLTLTQLLDEYNNYGVPEWWP